MASCTPHHLIISSQGANQKQKPFAPSELVRKVRGLLDHAEKGAVSGKAG